MDDFDKPAGGAAVIRTISQRVGPDPGRLAEFARAINEAQSPVLVIGAGVDRADGWDAGVRLAETLKVPVWAPPEAERASFPEDHPLFQGYLPFAIAPLAEKLRGHDLVVVIGSPVFRYYPYVPGDYLPSGAKLLHITDDPAEAARAPVGDSLLADARLALEDLLETVKPGRYPSVPARELNRELPDPPGSVLTPAEVFATLEAARPDNAVLLLESTSNAELFHQWIPITRPRSFTLFASGGLGWALPAAVGYALAARDTRRHPPVGAVLGDGATNYSIQALYTAARHRLPVVFLVLNNGEYGILKSFAEQQKTPGVPALDLPGIDFVALATGYGCAAARVDTSATLSQALEEAFDRQGPTLLEVPITAAVAPLLK